MSRADDALDALAALDALHVDALPVDDASVGTIGLLERNAIARWRTWSAERSPEGMDEGLIRPAPRVR